MNLVSKKTNLFRINLTIFFFCGLFTLWKNALVTSESHNVVFAGFSLLRILFLLSVFTILIVAVLLFINSFKQSFWKTKTGYMVDGFLTRSSLPLSVVLLLGSVIFLFASKQLLGEWFQYRDRLVPILWWMIIFSIQLIVFPGTVKNIPESFWIKNRNLILNTLIVFGSFLIIILAILSTRVGLYPVSGFWQDLGTPLLLWQVLIVWGIGSVLYLVFGLRSSMTKDNEGRLLSSRSLDFYIFITLWFITFIVWSSYPLRPSYNSLPPRAPNFEFYPFGDSIIYDTNAQNYLAGTPIPSDIFLKPFYSFFLAGLHIFAGQDYDLLVMLQVGVLAIIPSIIFSLTKHLSNRFAGMVASGLMIIRELNALSLTNIIQVSHTKHLMSDVLSMGLMVLLSLVLIVWLRNPNYRRTLPITIGGILGILALTRGHTLFLLPFVVLVSIVCLIPAHQIRRIVESIIIILIGLSIPLGIFLWRNTQLAKEGKIQEPGPFSAVQVEKIFDISPLSAYSTSLPGEDIESSEILVQKQTVTFILKHAKKYVGNLFAHYMHNVIYSYIFLPESFDVETPAEYVKKMPFWESWKGQFSKNASILLALNLFVIALGISTSYKLANNLIAVPIFLGIGYNFSVSLAGFSGWRFILPMDWISIVFYAIGLVQLTIFFGETLLTTNSLDYNRKVNFQHILQKSPWNWGSFVAQVTLFFLLAFSLSYGHKVSPITNQFQKNNEQILQAYRNIIPDDKKTISMEDLKLFLEQDQAVALYSRGLYPNYLPANKGELNYYFLAFAPRPFKRLVFQTTGSEEIGVVLPLSSRPTTFPNTANVLVIGCYMENDYGPTFPGYIDALAVVVETDPPILYIRNGLHDLHCPLDN